MKKMILWLTLFSLSYLYCEEIKITFIDRDLDWPLEGVMVQIIGGKEIYYTDMDGKLSLDIDTANQRTVLLAQYPGYDDLRYVVNGGESEIFLNMIISGVIEGDELVVERNVPGSSDETLGVSIAIDNEEMDTTANIGVVEDTMSSIKTLPGVGYSGGWNAMPSIRGGDPDELGTVLDGSYILLPYHWGGAFSIFNPNMIDSVKLSHGIFSARYGKALSGIMEVSSKDIHEDTRTDISISTSSTDLFVQAPLNEKNDLFIGGKLTYLETVLMLYSMPEITTAPYIRDLYGKWNYRPVNNVNIYLNGFLGTDGIGTDSESANDEYTVKSHFDYSYLNTFVTLGADISSGENSLYKLSLAYNANQQEMESSADYSGTRKYSEEFLSEYEPLLGLTADDSYSLDGISSDVKADVLIQQIQGRLEGNHSISANNMICWGVDESIKKASDDEKIDQYMENFNGSYWEISPYELTINTPENRTLESAAYLCWETGSDNSAIKGETGVRADHFYAWNEDMTFNTYPTLSPRFQISWKALEDKGFLDLLTLSTGSGLFARFPLEGNMINEDWDLEDFSIGADRTFMQVIGGEMQFCDDWTFKLESYYKYHFNRLYLVTDYSQPEMELMIFKDGIGHSAGYDLMLQKKINRHLDGYLSYSFIYTRLFNPYVPKSESERSLYNDPLNQWYYPDYHRFHNANLVLNWHPAPGWTFTTAGSFASGKPEREVGDVLCYAVDYDGVWIERYQRDSSYSDDLRAPFSIPIDFRLSYKHYKKGSKWQNEFYIAVEDAFINLYSPEGNTAYDAFTGTEIEASADFGIGMPIPSLGFKFSY